MPVAIGAPPVMRDGSSNVECRMSSKYGYSGKSGHVMHRSHRIGQHISASTRHGRWATLEYYASAPEGQRKWRRTRRPRPTGAHAYAFCWLRILVFPFSLFLVIYHIHTSRPLSLSLSIAVCARSSARLHSRFCDLSLLVTLRRTRTLLESEQPSKRVRPVGFGLVTRLSASPISLALCRLFTSR